MKATERRSTATWVVWVIVAGYILVSHGCHDGDHDTELFTRFWQWCVAR